MLNSQIAIGRNSEQLNWIRTELQTKTARCTMAVIHYPFDTSGPNGANPQLRDAWDVMHSLGVDVVVAGHDHLYERHAPQDASQRSDPILSGAFDSSSLVPAARRRTAARAEQPIRRCCSRITACSASSSSRRFTSGSSAT